ncbi:TIGR03089 family protein [Luteipulveratus sp. YIM 133132]|uniref:TIGR03089 family protein n=1 Tax=Luteipulveratus flavus TaxID=3031728 RepID=UPI0023B162B2|nr:TIGR03089 family protein [Luteipulveratus sp. YIM 133132]MDE9366989.1 TIGR03089 family protein [Luteipulveratus sp. YIM 133132]
MTPDAVLLQMLRTDPARPRVTYYDDAEGPTQGERIELSAKVLANWVAKAGNLLQDELDAGPGTVVGLDLPAEHWRTLYWALAAWAVGATVSTTTAGADVAVTSDPGAEGADVLVTLAALARRSPEPVPAGAVDEARELATYGDRLAAYQEPAPSDAALRTPSGDTTYEGLVAIGSGTAGRRAHVSGDLEHVLRETLATWADDGSVVLVRDADQARLPERLAAEGVTDRT